MLRRIAHGSDDYYSADYYRPTLFAAERRRIAVPIKPAIPTSTSEEGSGTAVRL